MESPSLCEPGVKHFIECSLKECHKIKDKYINLFYNTALLILFIVVVSSFLMYRYKGRMTPEEIALNNREKREYIMRKLRKHSNGKQQNQFLTDLPLWNNPETTMLNQRV